jgi:hypothetical protein
MMTRCTNPSRPAPRDYAERNRDIVERLAAGATLQAVGDAYGISKQMVSYINLRLTGRRLGQARRTGRLIASGCCASCGARG